MPVCCLGYALARSQRDEHAEWVLREMKVPGPGRSPEPQGAGGSDPGTSPSPRSAGRA